MIAPLALTLALGLTADYRSQYPLPTSKVPLGYGINIHFTNPNRGEMELLASAGFRWVRMDLTWERIEKQRGRYDFSEYDVLMRSLRQHNLRAMLILDYGNPLYGGDSPRTASTRDAFCRFVEAAVRHYRHQGVVWEMWNEPNLDEFWKPRANAAEYIALAKEVGETIRSTANDEWYVGPAMSTFDWNFLQRCFQAGLLRYWDAVTIHPYRKSAPETVAADWARLRAMINATGRRVPIFAGEWGYSRQNQGADEAHQSYYYARQYLTNLVSGVPMTILYEWRDGEGSNVRFGTVDERMRPKAPFRQIRHLITQLVGYTYGGRLVLPSRQDYLLIFKKGSSTKLVGYTTRAGSVTVSLPVGDAAVSMSSPSLVKAMAKGVARKGVTLTEEPRIFTPSGTNAALRALTSMQMLPPIIAADTPDELASALGDQASTSSELDGETVLEVANVAEEPDRPSMKPEMARVRDLRAGRVPAALVTDADVRPRFVRVKLRADDGTILEQESAIVPMRPLSVDLLPTARGLSVLLDNSSGRATQGVVNVSAGGRSFRQPFSLRSDQPSLVIEVPEVPISALAAGARITIEDAERPGMALLTVPNLAVSPLAPFVNGASGALDDQRYAVVEDGEPSLHAQLSATAVRFDDAPTGPAQGARLTYDFPDGWKFLTLQTRGSAARPLPGRPFALGMYVRGDGSGNLLRMRFVDSTGQVFQPEGGVLDWHGWRYVSIPLDGSSAGHWSGANDGIVHYPIRVETVALIDPVRRASRGGIDLASVAILSRG